MGASGFLRRRSGNSGYRPAKVLSANTESLVPVFQGRVCGEKAVMRPFPIDNSARVGVACRCRFSLVCPRTKDCTSPKGGGAAKVGSLSQKYTTVQKEG